MNPDDASLIGRLVVAAPSLRDPNFAHAVVLLLDHGEDGAVGVVLNRPSDVRVDTLLPEWADRAAEPDVVFVGGPVQTDAVVGLGRVDVRGAQVVQVLPGLGPLDLSTDPTQQAAPIESVRLFAGYAGWSAGQLEAEIEEGGWFVVEGDPDDAFSPDPDRLWREVLVRQGGLFSTVAADPSAN